MIRIISNTLRNARPTLDAARRCVGGPAASQAPVDSGVNATNNQDVNSSESTQSTNAEGPKKFASAAELKAMNNEGFFDNNITLSGVAGKCLYNVDDDNSVHAIRLPIFYKVKGDTRIVTATAVRSDLITFMLNNVDEGVQVCVRGTLGRPMALRNFTINAKHIQVLGISEPDQ